MSWTVKKQDFVGNIGIEIVKLEEEDMYFLSLTKYEKTKSIMIPIDRVDEIFSRAKKLVAEVD